MIGNHAGNPLRRSCGIPAGLLEFTGGHMTVEEVVIHSHFRRIDISTDRLRKWTAGMKTAA